MGINVEKKNAKNVQESERLKRPLLLSRQILRLPTVGVLLNVYNTIETRINFSIGASIQRKEDKKNRKNRKHVTEDLGVVNSFAYLADT